MVRVTLAVGLASLVGFGVSPAQQAACGGAPAHEQLARRTVAIAIARRINTAEARAFPAAQEYMPLALLKDVPALDGFDVQVSTDGETYAFSVKDAKDQCHAAVFSDQNGVIYDASPIR